MQNPKNILFIKLGEKGSYEQECIEKNSSIKLGYEKIDHNLCIKGQWDDVNNEIQAKYKTVQTATTSHKNQIRKFYEEPSSTMWITFYNSKLWYCYADSKITYNSDGTKESNWSDRDSQGNVLFIQFLSGRLTKVQGFRGTICDVKEKDYLLHKKLNHKDFEVFIDLIFRSAGWSRIGHIGSTIKTIDIELLAPVTNERAVIQIKSQSDMTVFNDFKNRMLNMNEYDKYFFVTYTPSKELQAYFDSGDETEIQFFDSKKISKLCINSGLIEWLVNVAP